MATSESRIKEIRILVAGKAGSGKSSLVNGILGMKIEDEVAAKENDSNTLLKTCTTEVKQYKCKKEDVHVTVWDTPGLYDGTQDQEAYVQEMVDKCSQNIDLMIYCINSSVTRFVESTENPEASVIRTLTEAFGEKIWKKTVIALTFANIIEKFHVNWSQSEKVEKFDEEIKKFEIKVRNLIITEAKVSKDVAHAIIVLPAGYYDESSLPGHKYWFTDLWFGCLKAIAEPETQEVFCSMNAGRIQNSPDTNVHQNNENQRIVPYHPMHQKVLLKYSAAGVAGVVFGGCVGVISLGIGLVPVAAGAVIGCMVFSGVGYLFSTGSKDSK